MLWALVTLIFFSALLLALAAFGPMRGTPATRPLFVVAALQALAGAALVVARVTGAA